MSPTLDDLILGEVSRETRVDLQRFEALFKTFAAHTNLVSHATLPDLWERHILDSAQILRLKSSARRWLDLGSGGGFPGLVVAILVKGDGGHVDLVESTAKKAGFLRSAAAELSLPATVWNERVEGLADKIPLPEAVTARALAPLPQLLEWSSPWLGRGATGLFHKGRRYREEAEKAREQWDFIMLEHDSLTDSESAILEISDLRRRKRSA